jgi:hypothetical protein
MKPDLGSGRWYFEDGDLAHAGQAPVPFKAGVGRFDLANIKTDEGLDLVYLGEPGKVYSIFYAFDLKEDDPMFRRPYIIKSVKFEQKKGG